MKTGEKENASSAGCGATLHHVSHVSLGLEKGRDTRETFKKIIAGKVLIVLPGPERVFSALNNNSADNEYSVRMSRDDAIVHTPTPLSLLCILIQFIMLFPL